MITLTVPGEPVGKLRPRITKYAAFTPAKTKNYEVLIREMFLIKYPGWKPIVGKPLRMHIKAYFTIPKSVSKKKRAQMVSGEIRHIKKPDTDNLIKSVADSLNTIAYHDDAQIVEVTCSKFYSDTPRMEVTIEEVVDANYYSAVNDGY